MRKVTMDTAKIHLPKLIEAALAGEDIVIAVGPRSLVRLVPIRQTKFQIGLLEGRLGDGPDFFAPMDPADLDLWECRT